MTSKQDYSLSQSASIAVSLNLGLPQDLVRCQINLQELPEADRLMSPGLKDIQVARISRLGHKDTIPRPWDWENLLSSMQENEELLWIASKEHHRFSLYIALKSNRSTIEDLNTVRDRSKRFSALAGGFCRRAFPESKLERMCRKDIDHVLASIVDLSTQDCIVVTGIPSPKHLEAKTVVQTRKDAGKAYSSLNDVLESLIHEDSFCLVFSLTKASAESVFGEIQKLNELRTVLSPYLKRQETLNVGKQTNVQSGDSDSTTKGMTVQQRHNILRSLWTSIVGTKRHTKGIAPSYSTTSSHTVTTSTSEGSSESYSTSISFTDSGLVMIDNHLEQLVEHLRQCQGTGGYYGAVSVHAPDSYSRRRIANCLVGVLSGSQTQLRPFQQLDCFGNDACFDLRTNLSPNNVVDGVALMNVHHATGLFLLPESELPGLQLKRSIFYGRASEGKTSEEEEISEVSLGTAAFSDPSSNVNEEGAISSARRRITISSEHLLSHMLITGATGSGKTVRTIKLLNKLSEGQFTVHVLETAKKVYRNRFRRGQSTPKIFNLGGFDGNPLRINPFYFDKGTSLKRHISVLCDALSDLLPVEALIGPKLREAVLNCYNSSGWDIETGLFVGDPESQRYPGMIDFNQEIARICNRLGYSSELNENYRGALFGRARVFIDDLYQDLFSHDGNTPFNDLFGGDCIIELADLPPSEINMPAFIVSMYLERLRAWRSALENPSAAPYSIVVIEEAHNILHKKLETEKSQYQTGGGKHLVEQLNRLLQEGRELGIGVIVVDQSPRSLADSVMLNTNTKLVHRLLDGDEAGSVGKSIGLKPDEWQDIHFLEDGECIVSLKHGGRPHKLAPFDKNELPSKYTPAPIEIRSPQYAAGARLINNLSRHLSLHAIHQQAKELVTLCKNDFALVDYMIGKHLAWNHQLNENSDLTVSKSTKDIAIKLCGLHPHQLDPRLEYSRLLISLIMNCDYEEIAIANHVYGAGWIDIAASAFLHCASKYCDSLGIHESVLESLRSTLTTCLPCFSNLSRPTEQSLEQLRLLAACSDNLNLIGMVISQSICENLLSHGDFLRLKILAGEWSEIHNILQDVGYLDGLEPLANCILPYTLKVLSRELLVLDNSGEAVKIHRIDEALDSHLELLSGRE